ncbi:MAG: O-antigen ligase family protein [Candidatus Woykebacteria bacterium]
MVSRISLPRISLSKYNLERIFEVIFLLLIPAGVFRVNLSFPGYESFFLFRILLLGFYLFFTFTFIFKRAYFFKIFNHVKNLKLIVGFFLCWILWSLTSYFWVLDISNYFRYNVLLIISVGFLLSAILVVKNEKILKKILIVSLATFGIALFVALLEIFFGFRLPGSKLLTEPERLQAFATSFFSHPNDFASYISLTLPFLVILPLLKNYKKYRILVSVLIIISMFALSFTGSKINFLATGFAGFIALAIFLREKKLSFSVLLITFIILIFSFQPSVGVTLRNYVAQVIDIEGLTPSDSLQASDINDITGQIEGNYGSFEIRRNLVINGLDIIVKHPAPVISVFSGVGAGQAEVYIKNYDNTKDVLNLHNWWLEVFVNHGVVIFLVYLAAYFYLLKQVFQKVKSEKGNFLRYFGNSVLVILAVFLLTSISPSSSVGYLPLWFTLGIAIAYINIKTEKA